MSNRFLMMIQSSPQTSLIISPIIIIYIKCISEIDDFGIFGQILSSLILTILQLTNMIDKTISIQSRLPTVISIKNILNKVNAPISMRSVTSAIRQYCLEQQQTNNKDVLLAFFLNCERKLKRNTQQDWNRTIQQQIRKIVGFQHFTHFVKKHHYSTFFTHIKQTNSCYDIQSRLNEQLGEMQISQDIHLKTKYFFQWFQYLHQRRQIKRLKNKEVEDLKKSRVFCQYSLKFYTFMQWKKQIKKTKIQKERAVQISLSASKRLASGIFTHFKEKIDIIKIQLQLEGAVREKIQQLGVKSVFEKLQNNKSKEQSKGKNLKKQSNIWIYRFYKFITHKMTPVNNYSSVLNRKNLQNSYEKLSLQLCWKGLKKMTLETNKKIITIRQFSKKTAMKDFIKIKKNGKSIKNHLLQLHKYKKVAYLKQLIVNLQSGNQSLLQISQKINQIQQRQQQLSVQSLFKAFRDKFNVCKGTKIKDHIFEQKKTLYNKRYFLTCLAEYKNKKHQIYSKLQRSLYYVSFKYFQFSYKQYFAHKTSLNALKSELTLKHNKYLLTNSLKGFNRYKKIKLNQSQAIMTIFKTIQQKKLSEVFQHLKQRNYVSCKLQKIISKTQFILVKLSFITIMNRMLSNKMKIKQFYIQQDLKLKFKLFQLLKKNSAFIADTKMQIQQISIKYSKRRLVFQLQNQLKFKHSQTKLQKWRQTIDKKHFFAYILTQSNASQELQQKQAKATSMLVANRFYEFTSSTNQFIQYRQEQNRLIYKLQKTLIQGVYRIFRKNIRAKRDVEHYKEQLSKEHQSKVGEITSLLAKSCLLKLVRSNKATLLKKYNQIIVKRIKTVLGDLRFNSSTSKLTKSINYTNKTQLLSLLKTNLSLKKRSCKCFKVVNQSKLKDSMITMQDNIAYFIQTRQAKSQQIQQWLYNKRIDNYQTDFFSKLRNLSELKENTMILNNVILRQKFQQLLKAHLNKRSRTIKEIVALRLYASNLKRRALRGLRRVCDAQILKQNRTRIQYNSKLSMQKSMDHVRKKSKLLQTIERYNHSRISRVVR